MATMVLQSARIPREFLLRRIHSLMGFWFLLFLGEHLFTNSQVALFFANREMWFVRSVDFLRNLPYLHVIEIVLLGIPILYHAVIGVVYLFQGRSNAFYSDGSVPLIKTGRNKAYTLQRWSAWILLFGIIFHVVQMRFIDYPYKVAGNFYIKAKVDEGLYPLTEQLGVQMYTEAEIAEVRATSSDYEHVQGLMSRSLKEGEVMLVSKGFGNLELINVRETFHNPWMCLFYTVFVLAAAFHGMNGFWTFLITWGFLLSGKSQSQGVVLFVGLMFLLGVLGMMSIWGTYFLG